MPISTARRSCRRSARRLAVLALVVAALVGVWAPAAAAHPLGNFTVNRYTGITVQPDAVLVRLVLDLAEVPTLQTFPAAEGLAGPSEQAATAYRQATCAERLNTTELRLDGERLALRLADSEVIFPPGQAGLATTRLTCEMQTEGRLQTLGRTLSYRDGAPGDRPGWREVVLSSDGTGLEGSDVPASSISGELRTYPDDLLSSPLDVRSATARVVPGTGSGPGLGLGAGEADGILTRGVDQVSAAYTDLVGRQDLTLGFGLFAVLVAALLGAVHALAPGHGKTVVAAYLVAERGDIRQAGLVGLAVTITHTLGVLVLGVALSLSATLTPTRLYPLLGLASGLLLAGVGVQLVRRARRREKRSHHDHDHGKQHDHGEHGHDHGEHGHDHGDHDHGHGPDRHEHEHEEERLPAATQGAVGLATRPSPLSHNHGGREHTHAPIDPEAPLSWRGLVTLGLAGGMVPAPSALLVLLGAIALGRAWFGVLLVLTYGVGMAATLTGAGIAMVKARGLVERLSARSPYRLRERRLLARLPLVTAAVVVIVGVGLCVRALAQLATVA